MVDPFEVRCLREWPAVAGSLRKSMTDHSKPALNQVDIIDVAQVVQSETRHNDPNNTVERVAEKRTTYGDVIEEDFL